MGSLFVLWSQLLGLCHNIVNLGLSHSMCILHNQVSNGVWALDIWIES